MKKLTYQEFKNNYLIQNYTDAEGNPKHTRLIKKYFYRFRKQLREEFGPQLDIHYCSKPSCQFHNTYMFDGKAIGSIDVIEKGKATVNYGMFTTNVSIDVLELVEAKKA